MSTKGNNKWNFIIAIGLSVILLILIGIRLSTYFSNKKNAEVKIQVYEDRPLDIVFGYEDEISPSKTVFDFGKEVKTVKILGGFLENTFYGAEETMQLAQLPGKQQLLGSLVGTMNAPVSNFVGVLHGNIRQFVQVLSQIKDNKQ